MKPNDLAVHIVAYLNDLLEHDREAITRLVGSRVECNRSLADHPTCEVGVQEEGWDVGMLGVLNGVCRIDGPCYGPVVAVLDEETNEIIRFEVAKD